MGWWTWASVPKLLIATSVVRCGTCTFWPRTYCSWWHSSQWCHHLASLRGFYTTTSVMIVLGIFPWKVLQNGWNLSRSSDCFHFSLCSATVPQLLFQALAQLQHVWTVQVTSAVNLCWTVQVTSAVNMCWTVQVTSAINMCWTVQVTRAVNLLDRPGDKCCQHVLDSPGDKCYQYVRHCRWQVISTCWTVQVLSVCWTVQVTSAVSVLDSAGDKCCQRVMDRPGDKCCQHVGQSRWLVLSACWTVKVTSGAAIHLFLSRLWQAGGKCFLLVPWWYWIGFMTYIEFITYWLLWHMLVLPTDCFSDIYVIIIDHF